MKNLGILETAIGWKKRSRRAHAAFRADEPQWDDRARRESRFPETLRPDSLSKRLAAVEQEGHRPVVDQLDLHHGPEDAGSDRDAPCADGGGEAEVEPLGLGRIGGLVEAGAAALAAVAQERELADH